MPALLPLKTPVVHVRAVRPGEAAVVAALVGTAFAEEGAGLGMGQVCFEWRWRRASGWLETAHLSHFFIFLKQKTPLATQHRPCGPPS